MFNGTSETLALAGKMTVLFKNKSDERKLEGKNKLTVNGNLIDEGLEQSLMLLDSEIIE